MEGYMDLELEKNRIIYLALVGVYPLVVQVIVIHHPLSLLKRNLRRTTKDTTGYARTDGKDRERVARKNGENRARENGKESVGVSRKDGEKRRI